MLVGGPPPPLWRRDLHVCGSGWCLCWLWHVLVWMVVGWWLVTKSLEFCGVCAGCGVVFGLFLAVWLVVGVYVDGCHHDEPARPGRRGWQC